MFVWTLSVSIICFIFFNDTLAHEIFTLSLHDALPILAKLVTSGGSYAGIYSYRQPKDWSAYEVLSFVVWSPDRLGLDRKSTRLNSSHRCISYAVFCLKKKNISTTICKRSAPYDDSSKC